jgi:hypothetical protein
MAVAVQIISKMLLVICWWIKSSSGVKTRSNIRSQGAVLTEGAVLTGWYCGRSSDIVSAQNGLMLKIVDIQIHGLV